VRPPTQPPTYTIRDLSRKGAHPHLVHDHYRYEDQIVIHPQPEQSPIPLPNFYVFLSTQNTLHDQLVLIEVLCMDNRTPKQRSLFNKVKSELQARTESGEEGLTLKHVNGIPRIVSVNLNN
jgi:hypothetical protein